MSDKLEHKLLKQTAYKEAQDFWYNQADKIVFLEPDIEKRVFIEIFEDDKTSTGDVVALFENEFFMVCRQEVEGHYTHFIVDKENNEKR